MSPTRLEAWARCPHAYLMEHVLGVQVVNDPERQYAIDPIDLGSLVHDALEKFVANAIGRKGGPIRWAQADREWLRAFAEQACDDYHDRGLTGREVFWSRDRARILRDLERFCDEDDERRAGTRDLRPVAVEHRFAGVEYPLDDGRTVVLRGSIDRIDRAADGSLTVIDYKTGGYSAFKDIAPPDVTVRGTKLQLPVYAAAARAAFGKASTRVHGAYWFITTVKGEWNWVGYDVADDVEKEATTALSAITAGIESGVFAARPNPDPPYHFIDCHFCNPDGLGSGDRRREWERKRRDPALAAYANFAEPGDAAREPGGAE